MRRFPLSSDNSRIIYNHTQGNHMNIAIRLTAFRQTYSSLCNKRFESTRSRLEQIVCLGVNPGKLCNFASFYIARRWCGYQIHLYTRKEVICFIWLELELLFCLLPEHTQFSGASVQAV